MIVGWQYATCYSDAVKPPTRTRMPRKYPSKVLSSPLLADHFPFSPLRLTLSPGDTEVEWQRRPEPSPRITSTMLWLRGPPVLALSLQTSTTLGIGILTAVVLLVVYLVGSAIYSLTLHPLATFPGPAWGAVSRIPFWVSCLTGRQVQWMHKLHARYGPVVRYSPNDLSYADQGGKAWKAIHGHEKGGREFPKAKEWFVTPANGWYHRYSRTIQMRRAV
jgi:hypothetical protein